MDKSIRDAGVVLEKGRRIHSVDKYVGGRLKVRRQQMGLSQLKLGNMVGLTFQQIQKYENGINRISSSKLYEFAKILEVKVSYFFIGYEASNGIDVYSEVDSKLDRQMERDVIKLVGRFKNIKNRNSIRIIMDMVKRFSEIEKIKD